MDERKGIWENGQLVNWLDMIATEQELQTIRTYDFDDYTKMLESKRS